MKHKVGDWIPAFTGTEIPGYKIYKIHNEEIYFNAPQPEEFWLGFSEEAFIYYSPLIQQIINEYCENKLEKIKK